MSAVMEPAQIECGGLYFSNHQSRESQNPAEPEFHQAVLEVLDSCGSCSSVIPSTRKQKSWMRITEPERVLMFRVHV